MPSDPRHATVGAGRHRRRCRPQPRLVERVVERRGSLPPATARSASLPAAALDRLGRLGDQLAGVEPAVRR